MNIKGRKPRKITVSIVMEKEQHDKLKLLAKNKQISVAFLARQILFKETA